MTKAGRLISLHSSVAQSIRLYANAVAIGLFLGVIGTLLHNSISPIGLIIALSESAYGIYYFSKRTHSKFLELTCLAAWLLVIYNAGNLGVSQELLIEGNQNGTIFLFGGLALNFFALIRAAKVK
jgi:hypothetical protein